MQKSDEAWIVVDKDQWTDEQLLQLYNWSKERGNYGLAVSNPKFEYWLLLHYEDGKGVSNSQSCSSRLKKHLPNYDKGIDTRKITKEMVLTAVERAKLRDNPPCEDWPRTVGGTTVYKLVENIYNSLEE